MSDSTLASCSRVLIIDDTPANIGVLCGMFESEGFEILVATNGESGQQTALRSQPDLILLDVLLPGWDGFEICRRLKSDPATADIPIIFITAMDESQSRLEGFRAGGVDYITKPFQQEEVIARARSHLTISRLNRELREKNGVLLEQIDRCQRAEEEVHLMNRLLEDRVSERTAQLQEVNRRLEEDIAQRKRIEKTLREFPRRIIETQEAERKRVAQELHDSIMQIISTAKQRLNWLLDESGTRNKPGLEIAATVRELLEKAMVEARRVSKNLRPPELDDFGLPAAARGLCETFKSWSGIEVSLKFSNVPDRLSSAIELNLYRIIQEALTNIQKHAQASHVEIHVTKKKSSLELTIKDNGIGFDSLLRANPSKPEEGFGLISMRERAASLRGALEIKSAPGHGTEIFVRVPIKPMRGASVETK